MKISGKVFDNKDEIPIPNVSITLLVDEKPSTVGTITNSKGEFILDSPLLDNLYNKVVISHVGYQNVSLSPSAANANIYMVAKGEDLPIVVVIGKLRLNKLDIIALVFFAVITTILIKYIPKIKQIQNL